MTGTLRFGILLMPDFTLTALAGFLDMLRLSADAGDDSSPVRCQWTLISANSDDITASNGLRTSAWEKLGEPSRFDYIVVVGGLIKNQIHLDKEVERFLQLAATQNTTIIGVCTGMFYMAKAGILDNHRICVSWFHYWDFLAMFPKLDPNNISSDQLYEIDNQRITCAGGRAVINLAAEILKRHLDPSIVNKALHILLLDQSESTLSPQPHPPWVYTCSKNPLVRRAILMMVQDVAKPFNIYAISKELAISERQIQRLFQDEVYKTPRQFFNELKLQKAVWLLLNSERYIADIANVCGFADSSHMSRSFKTKFNTAPSEIRASASLRKKLSEHHAEFYPRRWPSN